MPSTLSDKVGVLPLVLAPTLKLDVSAELGAPALAPAAAAASDGDMTVDVAEQPSWQPVPGRACGTLAAAHEPNVKNAREV